MTQPLVLKEDRERLRIRCFHSNLSLLAYCYFRSRLQNRQQGAVYMTEERIVTDECCTVAAL